MTAAQQREPTGHSDCWCCGKTFGEDTLVRHPGPTSGHIARRSCNLGLLRHTEPTQDRHLGRRRAVERREALRTLEN